MADKINLTIEQGSDFRRVLEFRNEINALMDLTGYEFRGQVREKYGSNVAFLIMFTQRDQTTETGVIDLHITSESTAKISMDKPMEYIYDIEMVDPESEVRRVMEGKIKVSPEVTK